MPSQSLALLPASRSQRRAWDSRVSSPLEDTPSQLSQRVPHPAASRTPAIPSRRMSHRTGPVAPAPSPVAPAPSPASPPTSYSCRDHHMLAWGWTIMLFGVDIEINSCLYMWSFLYSTLVRMVNVQSVCGLRTMSIHEYCPLALACPKRKTSWFLFLLVK